MKRTKLILKHIAIKGGTLGSIAKLYIEDENLGEQFILELKEQLTTNKNTLIKMWGNDLVNDVETFIQPKMQ